MARHNMVFLLGFVTAVSVHETKDGQPYAIAYVTVARANRSVGDRKDHMKLDSPVVMTRDEEIIREMSTWEENDIVSVKGVVAARKIGKGSICPRCGKKNVKDGALVYVAPIFAAKRPSVGDREACVDFLAANREVSNQAYVFGTLCTDPAKKTPKEGLTVTQYQLVLNRKYKIAADPPDMRTDYPWVKSYGANALQDRLYLHIGSQIFVDGCLQARNVNRHGECAYCGEKYDWKDRAPEIVPYENEYIANFYTEEEAKEKREKETAAAASSLLSSLSGYKKEEADAAPGAGSEKDEPVKKAKTARPSRARTVSVKTPTAISEPRSTADEESKKKARSLLMSLHGYKEEMPDDDYTTSMVARGIESEED